MTAVALTPSDWQAILHDPVRDKQHFATAIGPELGAYLAWAESEARKRPATVDTYERILARGARMYPALPASGWTKEHVRSVIGSFPVGSRPKVWAALSDFWKWMWEEERTEATPMRGVRRPKPAPQKIPEVFTHAEQAKIIDSQRLSPLPKADLVRVLLLLDTGLRRNEARLMRVRDVSTANRTVVVRNAKGGEERVVGFGEKLEQALLDYLYEPYPKRGGLPAPDDFFFFPHGANEYGLSWVDPTRPMGFGTFHRWWYRCLERAGVVAKGTTRGKKPHLTRHTYATDTYEATSDLVATQDALGHQSPETTRIYIQASASRQQRTAGLLESYRRQQAGGVFRSSPHE